MAQSQPDPRPKEIRGFIDAAIRAIHQHPRWEPDYIDDVYGRSFYDLRKRADRSKRDLDSCQHRRHDQLKMFLGHLRVTAQALEIFAKEDLDTSCFSRVEEAISNNTEANAVVVGAVMKRYRRVKDEMKSKSVSSLEDMPSILNWFSASVGEIQDLVKSLILGLESRGQEFPSDKLHRYMEHVIRDMTFNLQKAVTAHSATMMTEWYNNNAIQAKLAIPPSEAGLEIVTIHESCMYENFGQLDTIQENVKDILIHLSKLPGMGGHPVDRIPKSVKNMQEVVKLNSQKILKPFDMSAALSQKLVSLRKNEDLFRLDLQIAHGRDEDLQDQCQKVVSDATSAATDYISGTMADLRGQVVEGEASFGDALDAFRELSKRVV